MADVGQHTRVNPDRRIGRLMEFNRRLKGTEACTKALQEWNMELDPNLVEVPGRVLPNEKIVFGQNYT